MTVSHSVAAGNGRGFVAFSSVSGVTGEINADHCVASNNGTGFNVSGFNDGIGVIRVARSTATSNTTGFEQSAGGTFESLGDNLVRGNGNNTSGAITVVLGT